MHPVDGRCLRWCSVLTLLRPLEIAVALLKDLTAPWKPLQLL